jgi:adenylosuccinate lyase
VNPAPSFDPGFSTAQMSACFSPIAHVRAMLVVESAPAQSCVDAGLDDPYLADEIARACDSIEVDAEQLLTAGWQLGTPVLALRAHLRGHLSHAAAHLLDAGHGSTTQDIVDTGMRCNATV